MDVLEAALDLAQRERLPVFPCFPDTKAPATGLGGFYHATDDPDRIRRWPWKNRLVGVATGGISGVIVLDIDPDCGGEDWAWSHLKWLRDTRGHVTRRPGGLHLLWQDPGHHVTCSNDRIAPGVDVRADGGFVIWWPAHGYDRINYHLDPLMWPDWLDRANKPPPAPKPIKLTAASKVHRGDLIGLLATVEAAKNGQRNSCLHWAACRMGELAAAGLTESAAVSMLVTAAAQVGLDAAEAERTARSGFRRTSNVTLTD